MGKKTMVLLTCPPLHTEREFEVTHAERLLRMNNNGGWQLPENSKFEFHKDYGIRVRRNKKEDNGKQKVGSD